MLSTYYHWFISWAFYSEEESLGQFLFSAFLQFFSITHIQFLHILEKLDDVSLILIQLVLFVYSHHNHASLAFILPFLSPFDRIL